MLPMRNRPSIGTFCPVWMSATPEVPSQQPAEPRTWRRAPLAWSLGSPAMAASNLVESNLAESNLAESSAGNCLAGAAMAGAAPRVSAAAVSRTVIVFMVNSLAADAATAIRGEPRFLSQGRPPAPDSIVPRGNDRTGSCGLPAVDKGPTVGALP